MDTKEKRRTAPPRRSTRSRQSERPKQPKRPLQDVVYLPPKTFNRRRMLLRIATVVAIVLAIVLAMSVFFKVENIEVSGAENYTALQISEASGITQGDHLMSFGIAGAAAKIRAELPYVSKVRIGIRLPNTVLIQVTEVPVTYGMKAQDDSWWMVSSDGRVVDKFESDDIGSATKVLGVQLLDPQVGADVAAWETQTPGTDDEGNQIPITVTAEEKLTAALNIMKTLEKCGMIGNASSIDVTDTLDVQLWYGQQYQVRLGDTNDLEYKISSMKSAIAQLASYESGVLDVRFTEYPDRVVYTRFQ